MVGRLWLGLCATESFLYVAYTLYWNYLVHAHFILAWKNLIARLEILEPLLAYFLAKLYVVENCDAEHLINTVDNRRV